MEASLNGGVAKPEVWGVGESGYFAIFSLLDNCNLKTVVCASCSLAKIFLKDNNDEMK